MMASASGAWGTSRLITSFVEGCESRSATLLDTKFGMSYSEQKKAMTVITLIKKGASYRQEFDDKRKQNIYKL